MSTQFEFLKCFKWNDDPVKYLSIYLSKDKMESARLNWAMKHEKVKSTRNVWGKRNFNYLS